MNNYQRIAENCEQGETDAPNQTSSRKLNIKHLIILITLVSATVFLIASVRTARFRPTEFKRNYVFSSNNYLGLGDEIDSTNNVNNLFISAPATPSTYKAVLDYNCNFIFYKNVNSAAWLKMYSATTISERPSFGQQYFNFTQIKQTGYLFQNNIYPKSCAKWR